MESEKLHFVSKNTPPVASTSCWRRFVQSFRVKESRGLGRVMDTCLSLALFAEWKERGESPVFC